MTILADCTCLVYIATSEKPMVLGLAADPAEPPCPELGHAERKGPEWVQRHLAGGS